MERRFTSRDCNWRERESRGGHIGQHVTPLQRKAAETISAQRRPGHVPDLTDFMNDMFFGTVSAKKKTYNLTGGGGVGVWNNIGLDDHDHREDIDQFDDSIRSGRRSSSSTQEWLDEARRIVASSPTRSQSPARLSGSPRFVAARGGAGGGGGGPSLDRRDPLSRSARRHRAVEGFSEEILSKSSNHTRNKSDTFNTPPSPSSPPPSQLHQWFSNILKPPNSTPSSHDPVDSPPSSLPPRLSLRRKSRFQLESSATQTHGIPSPSGKTPDPQLLSPPRHLVESGNPRSISSPSCGLLENRDLSPPRNLVQSAARRSISSSTCSLEKIASKPNANGWSKEDDTLGQSLNDFLKQQRTLVERILNGELNLKAKIVLSGPSNSTASMVSAICYAWLLENRRRKSNEGDEKGSYMVVPVMNVKRQSMWQLREAAWLFHHAALDATSLLFADEVDLEVLMMAGQLNMLVVGRDVLRITNEVGSQCTILTDNYCEYAYGLLQIPVLKKLLLAGILLDTQNLNASATVSTIRDAEAVQLLLVGSSPNYRNSLFDQLMQDQKDTSFMEVLQHNYGKPPDETGFFGNDLHEEHSSTGTRSTCTSQCQVQNPKKNSNDMESANTKKTSPKSVKSTSTSSRSTSVATTTQVAQETSRGKNKFFWAKWFGFGSK